jgi:HD superfamily phosphodiesterase
MPFSAEKFYLDRYENVLRTFSARLPKTFVYHNAQHVVDVVHSAWEIAQGEGLDKEAAWTVKVAALYHDIGLIEGTLGHESRSALAFKIDAEAAGGPEDFIHAVTGCILATRLPQAPASALEAVLCDADLDYLGRSDFYEKSTLLFEEKKMLEGLNEEEWHRIQLEFLLRHSYHTAFNRKRRQDQVQVHFNHLKSLV